MWIKECCPKCTTVNWFCYGDPNDGDCSNEDPPGVLLCCNCKTKWIGSDDKETICECQNWDLWDEVGHNVEEFIKQSDESDCFEGTKSPR